MSALSPRGSLFDEFFREMSPGFFVRPLHGDPLPAPGQIRMDVREDDNAYTVQAEIPGVRKEDIHVSLEGGVVTVSAEIKQEDSKASGEKLLRTERYYGSVSRSFQLPAEVDAAKAEAKYENGVLRLALPKRQGSGAQRLTIV